jgi:hypothetical protein
MVDFVDVAPYPKFQFTPREFVGHRKCKVAWGDIDAFIAQELASNAWPTSYGNTAAYLTEIDMQPFPGSKTVSATGGLIAYEWAEFMLTYSSHAFPVSTGIVGTEDFSTYSAASHIMAAGLCWGSNTGAPVQQGECPPRISSGVRYTRTYIGMTDIPGGLLTCPNLTNNASLTCQSTSLQFATETLQFVGISARRTVSYASANRWTVAEHFDYAPNFQGGTARGWNWFWRADTCQYSPIYIAGGAQYKPYTPIAFSALFP